jgi:hypothetical protein
MSRSDPMALDRAHQQARHWRRAFSAAFVLPMLLSAALGVTLGQRDNARDETTQCIADRAQLATWAAEHIDRAIRAEHRAIDAEAQAKRANDDFYAIARLLDIGYVDAVVTP